MDGQTIIESTEKSPADAGNFECHICFEAAQEPVVTLCGHLYCWPCLYQWLHHHSHGRECPICKAYLHDDGGVIPIYGRGKSRPPFAAGVTIPRRPMGQRPPAVPPADTTAAHGQENDWDPTDGFMPMAAVRLGHMALSAIFGVLPGIFSPPANGFHGGDSLHGCGGSKTVAWKFGLGAMCIVFLLWLLFA